MVRTTFSMTEGDLKVNLRVDNGQTLVSVLFDGELIDQFQTSRVKQPQTYMLSLIDSIQAVMRDAANVPDLSPIEYA
jgi:hypothetical protein